jgi:hypothetical protein
MPDNPELKLEAAQDEVVAPLPPVPSLELLAAQVCWLSFPD